jgi:RNA polymerase-binding transcription factor DksA
VEKEKEKENEMQKKKNKRAANKSEWCVACGAEIPEGRMVCPKCERSVRK